MLNDFPVGYSTSCEVTFGKDFLKSIKKDPRELQKFSIVLFMMKIFGIARIQK